MAGLDAPPILEPAEHDLDLVALAIESRIVRDGSFAVALRGDAWGCVTCGERVAEPVGVVTPVADQLL